jgi:hypothetical protein
MTHDERRKRGPAISHFGGKLGQVTAKDVADARP